MRVWLVPGNAEDAPFVKFALQVLGWHLQDNTPHVHAYEPENPIDVYG